jgi:CheY-like chemotaxis protein
VLNRARLVGDRMRDVAARGKPFDVVVLDHNLPDASTEELLRMIRLDSATAGTYVVLLSALDFNASREGTRLIAPDVCIAKPVRAQLLHSALQASRLPREGAPATAATAEPFERNAGTEHGNVAALGLHVLVVDDNAINREVAVAMLEELGCDVALAEDGQTAVASAQQQRFDAILMDCQMPGMDGYAATEAIRRDESERGLPPR